MRTFIGRAIWITSERQGLLRAGPKEMMSCSVVLTKVPANPVGALELEIVPSDSATRISHWIWTAAPEEEVTWKQQFSSAKAIHKEG